MLEASSRRDGATPSALFGQYRTITKRECEPRRPLFCCRPHLGGQDSSFLSLLFALVFFLVMLGQRHDLDGVDGPLLLRVVARGTGPIPVGDDVGQGRVELSRAPFRRLIRLFLAITCNGRDPAQSRPPLDLASS